MPYVRILHACDNLSTTIMADSTSMVSLSRQILENSERMASADSNGENVKKARQDLIEAIQALQTSL